jgi:hypothetical protein
VPDDDEALAGLTAPERIVFGRFIVAQLHSPESRFKNSPQRLGMVGTGRLLASWLWTAPVWLIILTMFSVGFIERSHEPYEVITFLVVVGVVCIAMAVFRFITAMQAGRHFRESRRGPIGE